MPLWAKVDVNMRHHPKLIGCPDGVFRLWTCLILHAKQHAPDGVVRGLTTAQMRGMWGIQASAKALDGGIDYFISQNMLSRLADGALLLVDFEERQDKPSPAVSVQQQPPKRKRKIYFIRSSLSGRIKIGCSANPWARMNDMRTANSEELEMLATMPGDLEEERQIHERFKALRFNREWFTPGAALMRFVAEVSSGRVVSYGSGATLAVQQEKEEEKENVVCTDHDQGKSTGSAEAVGNPDLTGLSEADKAQVQGLFQRGQGLAALDLLASLRPRRTTA